MLKRHYRIVLTVAIRKPPVVSIVEQKVCVVIEPVVKSAVFQPSSVTEPKIIILPHYGQVHPSGKDA